MFMYAKYHGGTPKTCRMKKLQKTLHFYLWILRILLVLDTDWTHSLKIPRPALTWIWPNMIQPLYECPRLCLNVSQSVRIPPT